MNKERRAEIAKAAVLIEQAKGLLEICKEEEEEYFNNMPEGLQSGKKGDTAQEAISKLVEVCDHLDEIDLEDF